MWGHAHAQVAALREAYTEARSAAERLEGELGALRGAHAALQERSSLSLQQVPAHAALALRGFSAL
jgi:hypothetical protein